MSLAFFLVFAMFGMLSPASRGALMTAAIIFFMFMGYVQCFRPFCMTSPTHLGSLGDTMLQDCIKH